MNLAKVFSKILKAHAQGKLVSVVTDYENAKDLLKYIMSLPDARISNVEIADEAWNGYANAYLISFDDDGSVFCQKAIAENGDAIRGGGLYLIDTVAIGAHLPEEFVLDGEGCKIKLIGGD